MGNVVSLSNARKDRARTNRRRKADANAARFGQTIAQRRAKAAENDRARRDLDGKKKT